MKLITESSIFCHNIKKVFHREFSPFCQTCEKIIYEIGDLYYNFFDQTIILTKNGWDKKTFENMVSRIQAQIVPLGNNLKHHINSFINNINQAGFDISKIYLKTWVGGSKK